MTERMLSIVIPVYNRPVLLAHLLVELATAITAGAYTHQVEMIVIDDASEKAFALPPLPVTVKLLRNSQQQGAPYSRCKGLQQTSGRFVHFHDSDDSMAAGWLEAIMQELADNPQTDLLVTGRYDKTRDISRYRYQRFFHQNAHAPQRIRKRLVYRNCLGPLGGVTFSRQLLEKIECLNLSSCQDWQMYYHALAHGKRLRSRPDICFLFNQQGSDRISAHARKKLLGHLQLARITARQSVFGRHIRLFYLQTCHQPVDRQGGLIQRFYRQHRLSILGVYLLASLVWRMSPYLPPKK